MVPDTFHVINDQDAVPRSGKFIALYKRGGHRVIINSVGDMIVRPTSIEASMRQLPAVAGGGIVVASRHMNSASIVCAACRHAHARAARATMRDAR